MKMKSFVKESNHPELTRAVIHQIGGWKEFTARAPDIVNHGIGSGFSGFTYYREIRPFVEWNMKLILAHLRETASNQGVPGAYALVATFNCLQARGIGADDVIDAIHDKEHDDRLQVLNALAWYAAERIARAYDDACEGGTT